MGDSGKVVPGQNACLYLTSRRALANARRCGDHMKGVFLMAATDVTRGSVRADGNGSSVGRAARRFATETKQAFKTTEFWAMVGLVVAVLVSAAVINGGDNGTDEFSARQAWLYVSILGAGYFISRGLAKSGSREPYTHEARERTSDR